MQTMRDSSHFESGMVVGARWAALTLSQTANLWGFSRTGVSRVFEKGKSYRRRRKKTQFGEQQISEPTGLAGPDVRGELAHSSE